MRMPTKGSILLAAGALAIGTMIANPAVLSHENAAELVGDAVGRFVAGVILIYVVIGIVALIRKLGRRGSMPGP